MDSSSESNLTDINSLITKNYEIISRISRVKGKHMVIEISGGQFVMNEFSCNDLLRKIKQTYDVNESNYSGTITYRDCKMMVSDIEYVHNIDTRFECILVRLFPLSCIILKDSVLVVANENMKMDGFIKDLCRITGLYSKLNSDKFDVELSEAIKHSDSKLTSAMGLDENLISYNFKLPFEICVLECCFITSLSHLESDLINFESKYKILEDKVYNNKKFKDISHLLHDLKHPVSNMHEITRGFEDLINEILDSEENIKILEFSNHSLHYGTENMKNRLFNKPVNHDLQFLLEYFDQEIEQLSKRTRTLDTSLIHLERYISLELSIIRNEMMRLEVMCSILGISFGVGACLSGLFGMNVINGFESSNYAFIIITSIFLVVLCVAIYVTRVLQIKHRV